MKLQNILWKRSDANRPKTKTESDKKKKTKYNSTDLWTRAIHLLQIEPSRSAETPNSLRDLNDMLTNQASDLVRLKSNSQPWYEPLYFSLEAFNIFE